MGNLNGKWAILFKGVLALTAIAIPVSLGILGWVLLEISSLKTLSAVQSVKIETFVSGGPRYSSDNARADFAAIRLEMLSLKLEIQEWVRAGWPPKALMDRIELLERKRDTQP